MSDEQTMVERVARAMCLADELNWDDQADPFRSGNGDNNQEAYLHSAYAAIAAMRKPTKAMLMAGCDAGPDTNSGPFNYDHIVPLFRAVIDAALSEHQQPTARPEEG